MSFKLDDLNSWMAQIGELVNLLLVEGDQGDLNPDWFLNPWGSDSAGLNINGIPYRPQVLLPLLDEMLGPAIDMPAGAQGQSPSGTALKWYPIELEGAPTGLCLVLSDPDADYDTVSAYAGIGLSWQGDLGEGFAAAASIYLPLFRMDSATGGASVFCNADAPAQGLVSVSSEAGFGSGDSAFTTLQVQGLLALTGGGSPQLMATYLDASAQPVQSFTDCASFYTSANMALVDGILAAGPVDAWLHGAMSATTDVSPGDLLCAMGLLGQPQPQTTSKAMAETEDPAEAYQVEDISSTLQQAPAYAPLQMLFGGFDALADNTTPLFEILGGGIFIVINTLENGDKTYGLRVAISDLALGKVPTDEGISPAYGADAGLPSLRLQLGKWLSAEGSYEDSWLARSMPEDSSTPVPTPAPGVTVTALRQSASGDLSWLIGLDLVSIGLDYFGSVENPLVKLGGVTLRGIELRGAASWQYDPAEQGEARWSLGGAVQLEKIGLPLGTSYDRSGSQGSNPQAANAVASGAGAGGNAASGQDDSVNPVFSASASYLLGGQLGVQLYDEDGAPTDTVWFPMQDNEKSGLLFCYLLGLGWNQDADLLSFTVDGGLQARGFMAEFIKLSVGLPVTSPTDWGSYEMGLDGIDLSYRNGPIQLAAGLLYNNDVEPTDYEGQALIRAWNFSISAYGAWCNMEDAPSIFIFAMLDFPIPGPPAFFFKGLSGGFGINRALILPKIADVPSFPFVTGIDNPDILGSTPTSALEALGDYAPASRGDYWLAAGVKWTTYALIDTNAVASVGFGNDFEIGLTGLSVFSIPQDTRPLNQRSTRQGAPTRFTYAELGLQMVIDMGDSEFIAAAALSPNSYFISENFRLSGGFALDAWWGDTPQAGEFVLTLGGYAAAYQPPDYYPEVDRVGFSFAWSKALSMGGDLYCTLTTSNVMAGGRIDVSASYGGAALWFTADVDVILFWQPFYFDAHAAVTAGISYTVTMFGVSTKLQVEGGGSFNLWSPETGGNIEIDVWFIEFPINFGAPQSPDSTLPVDWETFSTMLPPAPGSMAPVYVPPDDEDEGDDPSGSGDDTLAGAGGGDPDADGPNDNGSNDDGDDTQAGSDNDGEAPDQDGPAEDGPDQDGEGDPQQAPAEDPADDPAEVAQVAPQRAAQLRLAPQAPLRTTASRRRRMTLAAVPEAQSAPANGPDSAADLALVQMNISTGLISFVPDPSGDPDLQAWLVRPALFGMTTSSVIPSQEIVMLDATGTEVIKATAPDTLATGILPMQASIDEALHEITITCVDTGAVQDPALWNLTPAEIGMPAAMWGASDGTRPPDSPEMVPDCLTGAADLRHAPHDALSGPPAFDILSTFRAHVLEDSDDQDWLPLSPDAAPATSGAPQVSDAVLEDLRQIDDPEQVQARDAIFAALCEMGTRPGTNGPLAAMAAQPSGAFRANPLLAASHQTAQE